MRTSAYPRLSMCAMLAVLMTSMVGACGSAPLLPDAAGTGSNPTLPAPTSQLIPTVNIAVAKGWPAGSKPIAAVGLSVNIFFNELDHPRWLYVLPNGDVLVAETNAPLRPDDAKGIKGFVIKKVMKKAGAGVPSANRISLLRDTNGDGIAETRTLLLQGLNSPFGMVLVSDFLYVANTDAVVRFPYKEGQTEITDTGVKLVDLPAGTINHHWTKNIVASHDGKHLYVSVGSNSNIAENGMDNETARADILEIDVASGHSRVFASGLRNPVGMAWHPQSGELWTSVNERDELGNDLVPDYMTSVKDGAFYGWPYSYYGQNVDDRAQPPRPDLVATAIKPDFALGSHTASLGLAFYDANQLPVRYKNGALIGQHGSWNRTPHSGYKVIFVPFSQGRPIGPAEDFLSGFLSKDGAAYGRPVGVAVDRKGAVLVADDVGNVIWRVSSAAGQ